MTADRVVRESVSPPVEGSNRVIFDLAKLGDGEFGLFKSPKPVPPLPDKFWIGKSGHGFLLKVERNPSGYPPSKHGKIERLRDTTCNF